MEIRQNNLWAYIFLIFSPALWGGNFLIGRVMHNHIPPFSFAFYRWLLVIILLFPMNIRAFIDCRQLIFDNLLRIIILSFFGISIYTSFIYYSLNFTSVISASLINALVPIFMLILTRLIYQELLTVRKIIGILGSILGVVFILTKGNPKIIISLNYNLGDFLALLAVIAWALFSVFSKKLPKNFPPFLFLFVTAIIGEIFLFPCFMIEYYLGKTTNFDMSSCLSIFYAAVFSSVLAITFWNIGVREVGPSKASYFFNLLTVFASILAIIFLGEEFHFYHMVGMFFVFFGIYVVTTTNSWRMLK